MAWYDGVMSLITHASGFVCMGFFGEQAIRMLRESWEGVIPVETDPVSQEQQVRPVGADLLAQEIFSMLNDNTPQTQNAPVTINQVAGASGLTIKSSGTNTDPAVLNVSGGNVTLAGTGTISIGTSSTATVDGSTVVLQGTSLVIPPIGQLPLAATNYDPLSPTQLPTINLPTLGNAYPGQVYMGRVVSGSAGTYTVSLAGITGNVTATVPQIGVGYNIPSGTYAPVVVTDNGVGGVSYSFQPYPFAPIAVSGARQSAASGGGVTNLLAGLATQGIITNSTTDSPQTVSGYTAALGSGGALANFLTAMANLGYVTNSATTTTNQAITGARQDLSSGGAFNGVLVALSNLGIATITGVTDSPQNITGTRGDGGPEIPALKNLLIGLANLGIITNNTTYP